MSGSSKLGPVAGDKASRETSFARPGDDVAESLDVDIKAGLATSAAHMRLQEFGPNRLDRARRASVLSLLLAQFRGVIVWLLTGAAVLSDKDDKAPVLAEFDSPFVYGG